MAKFFDTPWNRSCPDGHPSAPSTSAGDDSGVLDMTLGLNPISTVGNFANGVIGTGGQVAQQAAGALTQVKQEGAITDSAGPSKAENAQNAATEKADASQARLIAMQTDADIRKQTNDVLSAIRSGKEDSANKAISAEAQNAKGISY
ncbi:hypothetical protein [Pseudomonas sp. UBA1879]|uniref:hypothetical protein n=1 Tax=Pseudomonas sp. UBA1879 TaxID=1947305 RepID=UPI0025DBA4C0|nr:hypothetical protein [Pseudomonas sp. UBA1879]